MGDGQRGGSEFGEHLVPRCDESRSADTGLWSAGLSSAGAVKFWVTSNVTCAMGRLWQQSLLNTPPGTSVDPTRAGPY